MSWLWNSKRPQISGTCMFQTIAKEIQDAVQQTYSKEHDAAQIYEIDHHFIKEKLESGLVCTLHVSVENQVEDNITTGLPNC